MAVQTRVPLEMPRVGEISGVALGMELSSDDSDDDDSEAVAPGIAAVLASADRIVRQVGVSIRVSG